MLSDDMMTIGDERLHDEVDVEAAGTIRTPNPVHEGIVDVLSFRAFVRAFSALRRNGKGEPDVEFERALVKIINLNGTVARAIENDGRR